MKNTIGVIQVNKDNNLKMTFTEYTIDSTTVGTVVNLNGSKMFFVCSEKSFIDTSRALNAIISRVLKTQNDKGISFIDALNIYLGSMDHFIRVHKSKKK